MLYVLDCWTHYDLSPAESAVSAGREDAEAEAGVQPGAFKTNLNPKYSNYQYYYYYYCYYYFSYYYYYYYSCNYYCYYYFCYFY